MNTTTDPQRPSVLSLLWPDDARERSIPKRAQQEMLNMTDLGLDEVLQALSINSRQTERIRQILLTLCDDPTVITYRQEIIEDLLRCPGVAACLESLLPDLGELGRLSGPQWQGQTPLHRTIWRLGELELYRDCIQRLHTTLGQAGADLRSRGLCALREEIEGVAGDPSFQTLTEELPALRSHLEALKSISIGVNLDAQLRPIGGVLLAIHGEPFTDKSLMDRLLGRTNPFQGIAPLHTLSQGPQTGSPPFLHTLFKDLNGLLEAVAKPVEQALQAYVAISGRLLVALEGEIAFYLGAVHLIRRVTDSGLPMCRPQVLPVEERACHVQGIYNLRLALHLLDRRGSQSTAEEIVANDVASDAGGRIFILTGPNRGGKTTYVQAVGIAQVLCQAGLYVPGHSAAISPVDAIYTHFPVPEKLTLETGRLGEEARRLSVIFGHATRHSLILLNESLFSTSPGESLYLARDIVRALRLLGARAIYATHLHELATNLEAINAEIPGDSPVVSLVAEVAHDGAEGEQVRRTFRIVVGPPMGLSYAREIAAHYGISYEKLADALRERKVVE